MKTYILLPAFLFLLTLSAFAQEKPRITVEGISEMKIMPDEALITISLSEKAMTTSDVTNALNKTAKSVADALKKSGVTDYTFAADNYYVSINRIYTNGSAKDSGYVAYQTLRVVVENTGQDLIKVLESVQQSSDMGFQVAFRISDEKQKGYQEALLKDALTDAQKKAAIIASSLDLENLKVYHIDYSSSQPFQPVMYRAEAMMMKSADSRTEPTFNPEEQTVSDRVKVIFTFE